MTLCQNSRERAGFRFIGATRDEASGECIRFLFYNAFIDSVFQFISDYTLM